MCAQYNRVHCRHILSIMRDVQCIAEKSVAHWEDSISALGDTMIHLGEYEQLIGGCQIAESKNDVETKKVPFSRPHKMVSPIEYPFASFWYYFLDGVTHKRHDIPALH